MSDELTLEQRVDRLERALVQGVLPTVGAATTGRGPELGTLIANYLRAQDAAAVETAALDPHNRQRRR